MLIASIASWNSGAPGNSTQGATDETTGKNDGADLQWRKAHERDPEALDKKFGTDAQVACSSGSDEYLRSIASHDFSWDGDAEGIFGTKFDKISTLSAGAGLLTLASSRAKLSNVFGAFTHIEFYCLYDTNSGKIVRYSQIDPEIERRVSLSDPDLPSNNSIDPKTGIDRDVDLTTKPPEDHSEDNEQVGNLNDY